MYLLLECCYHSVITFSYLCFQFVKGDEFYSPSQVKIPTEFNLLGDHNGSAKGLERPIRLIQYRMLSSYFHYASVHDALSCDHYHRWHPSVAHDGPMPALIPGAAPAPALILFYMYLVEL